MNAVKPGGEAGRVEALDGFVAQTLLQALGELSRGTVAEHRLLGHGEVNHLAQELGHGGIQI